MDRDHSEESNSAANNPGGNLGSASTATNSANANSSSSATPSADQNGGSGSKRKRVSLACNACRLRKSKVWGNSHPTLFFPTPDGFFVAYECNLTLSVTA